LELALYVFTDDLDAAQTFGGIREIAIPFREVGFKLGRRHD